MVKANPIGLSGGCFFSQETPSNVGEQFWLSTTEGWGPHGQPVGGGGVLLFRAAPPTELACHHFSQVATQKLGPTQTLQL